MKKYLLYIGVAALVVFAGFQMLKPEQSTVLANGIKVAGEIKNEADVNEAIALIEDNLAAATAEDIDAYLDTLVASAHEATKKEMTVFFKDFTLTHELLDVTVLEQEDERLVIKSRQKSTKTPGEKQADNYRDHIAEANHTLIRENNQWRIAETIMTDTTFI